MGSPTFRPRIGLAAYQGRATWGVWDDEIVFVPRDYVRAVQRAGGAAVILPPDPSWADDPDAVLDGLDGLILCGGIDLDATAYGAEPHPAADAPDRDRDAFELALARRAIERDVPFLGICRGMQVMNVAAGGTLIQHLPDATGDELHRHTPGTFGDHDVELDEGSLAARAAGESVHLSKSHHHQAVDALGEGFQVTGRSPQDGIPEAIEAPDRRFALGVQWHPEVDETSRIIAALVEEAGRVPR
jgi:putative glutamine amidotransferase